MKTILAFETSGPVLSAALGTREGKIYEVRSKSTFQHSENLIPLVERLFKNAGARFPIDAFAIDRGPGSFTGLRIGASLLKGFLAVRKRPCYGALSLDMIAEKIDLPESSRLGIVADARREKIYSRFYRRKKGEWVAEEKLKLLSISELKERVRKGTVLAGDALLRYPELGEGGARLQDIFPSAGTLVRWFQTGHSRLTRLVSPRDFLPLYFRPSEAEEKRQTARRG